MSCDLPLEEPPRRLTGARAGADGTGPAGADDKGPRGADAWARSFLPWDCFFAVVWVATILYALSAENPGLPVRLTAAAVFALLAPWYLWVGRPLLTASPIGEEGATRYVVGLIALFMAPAVLVGETRLATFALVPQCFMLLKLRGALVAVVVINAVPVVGWALVWRPDSRDLYTQSIFALVTLVFSGVIGSWIIRIIEQSQERATLIAELEASREEISRLSAAHGALAERERMSREIHDTLAQGFTSLLMLVQVVESELERDVPQARRHLGLMAGTARQNLAEARALVAGGAPADLDGNSLPDALRRLAARHSAEAVVEVTGTARPLAPALEVVALRTCQEALANAAKHAGPGASVVIAVAYADASLELAVRDTGSGFDDAMPLRGYGLSGLRARAAEVGGNAEVRSAPGKGTTVSVRLPLPQS